MAQALQDETLFSADTGVPAAALTLATQIEQTFIHAIKVDGSPWFADQDVTWTFQPFDYLGLSLYTDFHGVQRLDDTIALGLQAHWYTDTLRSDSHEVYALLDPANLTAGSATWGDILYRYWSQADVMLKTGGLCLPDIPPTQYQGELAFGPDAILYPGLTRGWLSADSPVIPAITLHTSQALPNLLVHFAFADEESQVIYTDTVSTGFIVTGTHQIDASRPFTPTPALEDEFVSLTVILDYDNRVTEDDEANNLYAESFEVVSEFARPQLIISGLETQWVNDQPFSLIVNADQGTISQLRYNLVQYQPGQDPKTHLPTPVFTPDMKIDSEQLPYTLTFALGGVDRMEPGATEMVIWGIDGGNFSKGVQVMKFNYVPDLVAIEAAHSVPDTDNIGGHYYRFTANQCDDFRATLTALNGDALDMYVWTPFNYEEPLYWASTAAQPDLPVTLPIVPVPYDGQYVLAIFGEIDATYNLAVSHQPGTCGETLAKTGQAYLWAYQRSQATVTPLYVPQVRPNFLPNILEAPPIHTVHLPIVFR